MREAAVKAIDTTAKIRNCRGMLWMPISSQACGQRADAEPKQHKSGCEDLSDYQNRAQDGPEDPDVVFHSALKSATKRHKMHKRKARFAGLFL